ncbi:hypothetical protein GGR50DRAFT_653941 [Xylaria sp. CBS 124048]|nr:hypothetical protein GGR50DRAFT_653941 [Xylaria sp. CBS 124048]
MGCMRVVFSFLFFSFLFQRVGRIPDPVLPSLRFVNLERTRMEMETGETEGNRSNALFGARGNRYMRREVNKNPLAHRRR